MHRRVAAAVFAALTLAAAGCGGGDDDGGTSLTRAALVSRVEQICEQASKRVEQSTSAASRDDKLSALLTAAAATQKDVAARLERFEAPDELSEDWETFKDGIAQRADVIGRAADSATGDDQRVLKDVEGQIAGISRRVQASAQALGVRSCS